MSGEDRRRRTLYLHVGMSRCGSSAIQQLGETHRTTLSERGLLYPSARDLGFTAEQSSRGGNGRPLAVTGDPASAIARIADHLVASDADRFLISSEQLLAPQDGRLARLAEALAARGIRAVAVLYVREQRDWLVARWARGVRSQGWAMTLEDYIAGRLARGTDLAVLTYGAQCDHLAGVFGRDNVVVRRFEADALQGGDVAVDAFAVAGVDVADLVPDEPAADDAGAPLEETVMIRLVNAMSDRPTRDGRAFLRHLDTQASAARIGPPLYRLASPRTMRAIADHFAPINEAFRRTFLPDVPAPVLTGSVPADYEQITEDDAVTTRALTTVGSFLAARADGGTVGARSRDRTVARSSPTAARFDDRMSISIYDWYELLQEQVMRATNWMGVPMRKNPLDAWVYQELVHRVRPDVIVEIGSYIGGSTMFFAHLLDILGHGEVVSVEVRRDRYVAEHPRITEITGESLDPEVIAQVSRRCAGRRAMVIQDGDHSRGVVLGDLRAYADLVPIGSYFVVEDGNVDQFPLGSRLHPRKFEEGPLLAIEDFLRDDDRFEIDRDCERYLVTWNPSGYLRRVR